MKTISRTTAVRMLKSTQGRLFTVLFEKRSDGQLRRMNCRTGVKKGIKGTGKPVDPKHKLITVWDMKAGGFRSIPEEGIKEIKFQNELYVVR